MLDRRSCFVIMPFQEPFETYYLKIIKPAIDQHSLLAIRGDSLFTSTQIMDDIWKSIQESSVVIAELTGRNANVFYELGLAHAISKPVILVSSSIEDVPFDLRPLRVLIYDKNDPEWGLKLSEKISKAIEETLKSPLSAIPHTFKEVVHAKVPKESEIGARLTALEESVNRLNIENVAAQHFQFSGGGNSVRSDDISINDTVLHPRFGKGVVISIEGRGSNQRCQINFESEGVKWLVSKYASLKKLNC